MKLLAFTSGAMSLSMITLGLLFKIEQWPGSNIVAILGLASLGLIFIPSIFAYHYKKGE